jgi:hypothetical protein
MSVQLESISGLIELRDEFTSQINVAAVATKVFGQESAAVFGLVGIAAGTAAAAIGGITTAIVALGSRGADVNDVNATLDDFAGSAANAHAILDQMRAGVLGTVDDFDLASRSAKLLQAGIGLTADEFGTLSSAAFVLQNRGLGDTKTMLDAVSDAMVTGRTRALAQAGVLVDLDKAEAAYAETLGIEEKNLTEAGKAQAHRLAILEKLNAVVAEAGAQQRDFGEEFEHAQTAIANWIDHLGSAIAASPALTEGIRTFKAAFDQAFGLDSDTGIATLMGYVKDFAIVLTDVGLGAVEFARVVHTVWSAVQVAVLEAVKQIVDRLGILTATFGLVAKAGAAIGILPEGVAASIDGVTESLHAMSTGLAEQRNEAMKGVTGTSAFDQTLDKLGGTLYATRDALDANAASAANVADATDIAEANAKKLTRAQADLDAITAQRAKNEDALWKIEEKSLKESEALWREHANNLAALSGTGFDDQRRAIETWAEDEVAKLDDSDRNWQGHYDAIQALAHDKLDMVGSEWTKLKDLSVNALQQQANAARDDYNRMITSGLTFSREVLDAQRQKYEDLQDQVRGYGDASKEAHDNAAAAAAKQKAEVEALAAAERKAWEEAEARRKAGGSREVTSQNFEQAISTLVGGGTAGTTVYHDPYQMARAGYSFAEIAAYAMNPGPLPPPRGPAIPGFGAASRLSSASSPSDAAASSAPSAAMTTYPTMATGATRTTTGSSPIVHNAPGAIVVNFPVTSDPKHLDHLADVFAEVFRRAGRFA